MDEEESQVRFLQHNIADSYILPPHPYTYTGQTHTNRHSNEEKVLCTCLPFFVSRLLSADGIESRPMTLNSLAAWLANDRNRSFTKHINIREKIYGYIS